MKRGMIATGALALSMVLAACGAPSSTDTTSSTNTDSTAVTGAGESSTSMPAMEPTTAMGSDMTGTTTAPSTSGTTTAPGTSGTTTAPGTSGTTTAPGTSGTTTAPGTSGTTTAPGTTTEGAVAALLADPQFSTLSTLLSSTGLDQQLEAAGPVTIFAPTDEAFAALPQGTLAALSQNPTTLIQILRYHVAEGAYRATDITQEATVPTLEGEDVTLSVSGTTIRVNDTAEVVSPDINAGGSVIHAIDQVLLPSTVNLPPAGASR